MCSGIEGKKESPVFRAEGTLTALHHCPRRDRTTRKEKGKRQTVGGGERVANWFFHLFTTISNNQMSVFFKLQRSPCLLIKDKEILLKAASISSSS